MKQPLKRLGVCPVSRKECKLCTVYRGRHYRVLGACMEYRLKLLKASSRLPDKKPM